MTTTFLTGAAGFLGRERVRSPRARKGTLNAVTLVGVFASAVDFGRHARGGLERTRVGGHGPPAVRA
jgi:hypothetical protein